MAATHSASSSVSLPAAAPNPTPAGAPSVKMDEKKALGNAVDNKYKGNTPIQTIDFDNLMKQWGDKWAEARGAKCLWVAYSDEKINHYLPEKSHKNGKKPSAVFTMKHTLQAKQVGSIDISPEEESKLESEIKSNEQDFPQENSSTIPANVKIPIKDTVTHGWTKTKSVSNADQGTISATVSVPEFLAIQATYSKTITETFTSDKTSSESNETTIPVNVTIPATSRCRVKIISKGIPVYKSATVKISISGSVVISCDPKVKYPADKEHHKCVVPLTEVIKDIKAMSMTSPEFELNDDEILFTLKEKFIRRKLFVEIPKVYNRTDLEANLVVPDKDKSSESKSSGQGANKFVVAKAKNGGEFSAHVDAATKAMIVSGGIAKNLVDAGFFSKDRPKEFEALVAEGPGAKVTLRNDGNPPNDTLPGDEKEKTSPSSIIAAAAAGPKK